MCKCFGMGCATCRASRAAQVATAAQVETTTRVNDPFKIVSVERFDAETVKVRVRMDAKEWAKNKRSGLGQLYGIDISNVVYRLYGVKAYNPTVADRDRAQGGVKWLELFYNDAAWVPAPNNVIEVDFINRRRKSA